MSLRPLDGRVVVVTGAAGLLGSRFAAAVARAGADVALLDLAAPGEEAVAAVERAGEGVRVLPVACDVTDDEAVRSAALLVEERLGPVEGLVNAAAIDAPPGTASNGPFETTPSDWFARVLDVNVQGVVRCCQAFGGAMARRGGGAIVNVASTYGVVGPDQRLYDALRRDGAEFFKPAAYSTSKAGVLGLTRYLAAYWGAAAVRVNALVPGGVESGQHPEFIAAYAARTPLGRMARPDEYDGAVVFLLSDASTYMTGASLVIDGGFTAW